MSPAYDLEDLENVAALAAGLDATRSVPATPLESYHERHAVALAFTPEVHALLRRAAAAAVLHAALSRYERKMRALSYPTPDYVTKALRFMGADALVPAPEPGGDFPITTADASAPPDLKAIGQELAARAIETNKVTAYTTLTHDDWVIADD